MKVIEALENFHLETTIIVRPRQRNLVMHGHNCTLKQCLLHAKLSLLDEQWIGYTMRTGTFDLRQWWILVGSNRTRLLVSDLVRAALSPPKRQKKLPVPQRPGHNNQFHVGECRWEDFGPWLGVWRPNLDTELMVL